MSTKSSWLVGESCLGLMTWYMAWQVPPCHTHTPSLFSIYSQRVWWFQSIIWIYWFVPGIALPIQIRKWITKYTCTWFATLKLTTSWTTITDQYKHCRSTWTSIERKFTTNWRLAPDYCEWTDPHLPHVTTQFECSYYNRVKHPQLLCHTCPMSTLHGSITMNAHQVGHVTLYPCSTWL